MKIWKFSLLKSNITMPLGAKILSCQLQMGCPTLWAAVDPNAPTEERIFQVAMTGGDVPENAEYIATCVQPHGLVLHIFEEKKA